MTRQQYEPRRYWNDRLKRWPGLRATGHASYSEAYNGWLYRAKRRALMRALASIPPGTALDLGSGSGWVISELQAHGYKVHGCDIAEDAVDRLRATFPEAEFFPLALGEDRIPRPDASFNLVTALDVLYHVVDDRLWRNALSEIARVLKTGGSFVISDSLGESETRQGPHVKKRGRDQWLNEASQAGLSMRQEVPLYRWLSRDPGRWSRRVPGNVRGAAEYALERLVPRRPHMRLALFVKESSATWTE